MTNNSTKLKRREGTSGISGQLYETKLLSLIYFRATHEHTIEEFHLIPNVDHTGAFDDICLKVKVEALKKPIFVFMQAKHKENTKQTLKIDFSTYFISFMNIRQEFDPSHKDWLFKGTFDNEECFFVIYTNARDQFTNVLDIKSGSSAIVNDLIDTGGTVKQPSGRKEDVKSLCKVALEEQMKNLAKQIAKLIDDGKFQLLLTNEVVLRFHVILAQKVVDVSEIQSGYRIASFRHEFFETQEEYLTIFKDTLFTEILKERKIEASAIEGLLSQFSDEPTSVTKLSEVIGTVITYKKGVLEIKEKYKEYLTPQLKQVNVSALTVHQATELAAKQILLSPDFKMRVPSSFGNKDLTCNHKRIQHLTTRIIDLLRKCTSDKIVTIDESLEVGLLQINGGLAGAVGNIFVLDDDTKLMKITDNSESLRTRAKQLYESLNEEIKLINEKIELSNEEIELSNEEIELSNEEIELSNEEIELGNEEIELSNEEIELSNEEIELSNIDRSKVKISNLCEYKFSFKVKKFPKLLLEFSEYEEELVKDFLNKLVIYSNQANEKSVEETLKKEIIETLLSDYNQEKIDDIFLKYHNAIQTWWRRPEEFQSLYLTKNSQMFEKATCNIIEDPLISSLSAPYIRQLKGYNYMFTEDAVRSLNLQNQQPTKIIVAKSSTLAIVKVFQYLKNKEFVALNIELIVNLTYKKRLALIRELKAIKKEKVVILVYDKLNDSVKGTQTLENVADAVRNKTTIIIADHLSVEILQRYFKTVDATVHDKRYSLIDMNEETQRRVLKRAKVKYQGMEVGLENLVSGWPRQIGRVSTEERTVLPGLCHGKIKSKI